MPTSPSTRLGLVGPSGTDNINLGDDDIRALITQLEAVGAGYKIGTSRPAASAALAGYVYINTSSGLISFCTGTSWIDTNPVDAAAATGSMRTLGPGATQAAPGNDARFVQPGIIQMTGAATPDTGFLMCDGAAVSRATYPDLFARIGTIHGPGDGTTTFNLPDLRGRSPIGAGTAAGAAGATAHALGSKGGEETHQLTTGELAAHTHTAGAGGNGKTSVNNSSLAHAHVMQLPVPGRTGGSSWGNAAASGSGTNQYAATFGGSISDMNGTSNNGPADHDHSVTINNAGGGGSHNNMQPYAAVNFQIKT